jgi:hypothetical protein
VSLFDDASLQRGFPRLNQLPWLSDLETALRMAREMLGQNRDTGRLVSRFLAALSGDDQSYLLTRSMEKATHYKWLLGDGLPNYMVWLHQYKSPDLFSRTHGFARSVHNHRYGFSSKVLSGAMHVSSFCPSSDPAGYGLERDASYVLRPGDVITVTERDIHRIDAVEPRTRTVVVQGPVMRNYSTTYDLASGERTRIYDLDALLPDLVKELA